MFVLICEIAVRLSGGGADWGRVEVYHAGEWGTVCHDSTNSAFANIVCNELG
jgi:serine protease 12 (motopsin)